LERKRKTSRKAGRPEPFYVRWFFYIVFLLLLVATFYFSAGYGVAINSGNQALSQLMLIYSSVTTSFLFSVGALSYMLFRGMRLRNGPKLLGLSRNKFTRSALGYGIILAGFIIFVEIALAVYSIVTNTQIPSTNTQLVLAGMPLSFLLFSAFIAPINEEIFFRGFLVPRVGIILSAIIFSIFHLGYGSVTEFGGVVLYGLAAGYLYKKKGSLYSTILAHVIVNLLAISQYIM
jgi:hypothetical protein